MQNTQQNDVNESFKYYLHLKRNIFKKAKKKETFSFGTNSYITYINTSIVKATYITN